MKLSTQELSIMLQLWPGSNIRTGTWETSGSDGARLLLLLHKQIMAANKNQAGVCKGEEGGGGGGGKQSQTNKHTKKGGAKKRGFVLK